MVRRSLRVMALGALMTATSVLAPNAAIAGDDTLGRNGAVLRPPRDSLIRALSPFHSCQVLLDSGDGDCAVVGTANGQLVFTVESGPPIDDVLVSRPWVVRVYRETHEPGHANEWKVTLATRPQHGDLGPVYADVRAEVGDVTGDGKPELLVGYRSEGTGQILDIDIVGTTDDGTPKVLAHDQLYKGTAKIKGGTLITWSPVYRKSDANCCPTSIRRDVVRFRDGAFVVQPGPKVPTARASIPPGDF